MFRGRPLIAAGIDRLSARRRVRYVPEIAERTKYFRDYRYHLLPLLPR